MGLPTMLPSTASPRTVVRVQNAACGRSGSMLNFPLMTTAEYEARWTADIGDNELGHGTEILS
jgi:hypothetical protein